MELVAKKILDICSKYAGFSALNLQGSVLNYQQLHHEAAQLANCLKSKTSGACSKNIGILTHRSKTTYLATLACLFAGYTFVPLNKNLPSQRLAIMIETAAIAVIIVDKSCMSSLETLAKDITQNIIFITPESQNHSISTCKEQLITKDIKQYSDKIHNPGNSSKDIAYILFTSGSTGLPKGVPISHGNLASFVEKNQTFYHINAADRLSQTFEHTFDLSLFDMMMAWCSGACLYAMQAIDLLSPVYFIAKNQITIWFSVPSLISLARKKYLLKPDSMPSLRLSLFCGEALSVKNIQTWQAAAPQSTIDNLYGPTELTIACARYRWKNGLSADESIHDIVPIGKIYSDHTLKILDENNHISIEGELCISGPQMFKGYLQDKQKTKTAFVTLSGQKFYRTGDRVRIAASGDLLYLGRTDHQIKVNGYRVEAGEIESCIKKFPHIIDAIAVGLAEQDNNFIGIAAFITTETNTHETDIITFVRENLPTYMVPALVKTLHTMPLNSNGKIDRKKLTALANEYYFLTTEVMV